MPHKKFDRLWGKCINIIREIKRIYATVRST